MHISAEHLPLEFLLEGGNQLALQRVLRDLPGQRLVADGTLAGKAVICKAYLGDNRRSHRHWQREWEGLIGLKTAGIRTPELVFKGLEASSGAKLVVTEKLLGALSFFDLGLLHSREESRLDSLKTLVEFVAKMHGAGILQKDMHLQNFLLKEGLPYAIDGGGIEVFHKPLPPHLARRNLALLLAQFPLWIDSYLEELIRAYRGGSPWTGESHLRFKKDLEIARFRRDSRATKKLFRNCSEIRIESRRNRFVAVGRIEQGEELDELLENPDQWVDDRREAVLKNGNSSTVVRCQVDGRALVIKRYNLKGFTHRLRRALTDTRASNSWVQAHRLLRWGFRTPKPVAIIEERFGPLRGRAFFISEAVDGLPLLEAVAEADPEQIAGLAQRFAEFLLRLTCLKQTHGDMKADNFLVSKDELWILDLDAMSEHKTTNRLKNALTQDVTRLDENWRPKGVFMVAVMASAAKKFQENGLFAFPVIPGALAHLEGQKQ